MEIKENTKLVNKGHPEWGEWTVLRIPTPKYGYYEIRNRSGVRILDPGELEYWKVVKR